MSKHDPLAAALDAVTATTSAGPLGKVEALFGDRSEVLDSIRRARKDRKLSYAQIAKVLSSAGVPISAGAVQNWLAKQGID